MAFWGTNRDALRVEAMGPVMKLMFGRKDSRVIARIWFEQSSELDSVLSFTC